MGCSEETNELAHRQVISRGHKRAGVARSQCAIHTATAALNQGIRDRGDSAQGEKANVTRSPGRLQKPSVGLEMGGSDSSHPTIPILANGAAHDRSPCDQNSDQVVSDLRRAVQRAQAETAAAKAAQRRSESAAHEQLRTSMQARQRLQMKVLLLAASASVDIPIYTRLCRFVPLQIDQAAAELYERRLSEASLREQLAVLQVEHTASSAQAQQASAALQATKAASKQHKQRERKLTLENRQLQSDLKSTGEEMEAVRAHMTAVKAAVAAKAESMPTSTVHQASQTLAPEGLHLGDQIKPDIQKLAQVGHASTEVKRALLLPGGMCEQAAGASGSGALPPSGIKPNLPERKQPHPNSSSVEVQTVKSPTEMVMSSGTHDSLPGAQHVSATPHVEPRTPTSEIQALVELRHEHEQLQACLVSAQGGAARWQEGAEAAGWRADAAEAALQRNPALEPPAQTSTADACVQIGEWSWSDAATQCHLRAPTGDAATSCDLGERCAPAGESGGGRRAVQLAAAGPSEVEPVLNCQHSEDARAQPPPGEARIGLPSEARCEGRHPTPEPAARDASPLDACATAGPPADGDRQEHTGRTAAEHVQSDSGPLEMLAKLLEAAGAACAAAQAAEEHAQPRLVAHIAFLTSRVAKLLQNRGPVGMHHCRFGTRLRVSSRATPPPRGCMLQDHPVAVSRAGACFGGACTVSNTIIAPCITPAPHVNRHRHCDGPDNYLSYLFKKIVIWPIAVPVTGQ